MNPEAERMVEKFKDSSEVERFEFLKDHIGRCSFDRANNILDAFVHISVCGDRKSNQLAQELDSAKAELTSTKSLLETEREKFSIEKEQTAALKKEIAGLKEKLKAKSNVSSKSTKKR